MDKLHNIEAEQQLLGALLGNNDLFERVSGSVESSAFFDPVHGDIFEKIAHKVEGGMLASPVTLKSEMAEHEGLNQIGGAEYLARLVASSISTYAVRDYAKLIADLAKRRQVVTIASDMQMRANDDSIAMADQIEAAESQLYALAENGSADRGTVSFLASLTKALTMANDAYERGGKMAGLETGLIDLDRKLGGLVKSDLIILAGRPSMGKTSLATNMAYHIAKTYNASAGTGGRVGFFSLEMSHDQLTARILSDAANIPSHKSRNGDFSAEEFEEYFATAKSLNALPIFTDDTPSLSISQVASRARRMKRVNGIDVLFVDYLQLMQGTSRTMGNRVLEIGEITMGLKAIAKELDIPVVALSQLSRAVETREDKRPMLSDLRDSGSIEQDADVVMFVYRDEYYAEREEPKADSKKFDAWFERYSASQGKADIIIGKQRHGSIGTVEVSFEAEFTRFGNLEKYREAAQ